MGIKGLWPLIKSSGYALRIGSQSWLASRPYNNNINNGTVRVDVLACFYTAIRYAYIRHPKKIAQTIVEREVVKYGILKYSWLYIDGIPPQEKSTTLRKRTESRKKAMLAAQQNLGTLEQRINNMLRVRKSLFRRLTRALVLLSNGHQNSYCTSVKMAGSSIRLAIVIDPQPED
ncbi:hypothetical protein BGZ76_001297, partial [Entomortierella beljakovae]